MALILILDDDMAIRQALKRGLEKAGHRVIEAGDGRAGCELAARFNPDLCVTDVLMPDKEGIETIHDLRASNPNIKIIAISGGGQTRNSTFLEVAADVGADAVLAKPFRPAQFLELVARVLASTPAGGKIG